MTTVMTNLGREFAHTYVLEQGKDSKNSKTFMYTSTGQRETSLV